ncbi:tyrosine-type recombinase/integrase [Methylobacterium sp. J-048]|uniref:tyrosine-type recombinase/integrase n=1 Tax=Methylobacterium sp. J-048 TaxID=2836635 RepID=UPI001FBAC738|nr:tyrosine-type recombinase/integrase [Methylobacterium sp. J-048]MCJ2055097.1 tyrosine-type recombinase/integrase [Methylobacterium sp. J-048]
MSDAIEGVKPVRRKLSGGETRVYYYHRATGHRLPDDPTTPAFKLALEQCNREAEAEAKPPETGSTIGTLIQKYQSSADWTGLAEKTRETEQFNINAIFREWGDMPLATVERKGSRTLFLEWRDDLAEQHPRAADAKLARLARILKFAHDREMIDRHPLATFKRVYKVDRSENIWLPEHFAALNSTARAEIKLIAFVALHTGQRRGDLIALRWAQYDGAAIKLTQSKTKARVYIPCTKALKAILDDLKAIAEARAAGFDRRPGHNGGPPIDKVDIGALHILNSTGATAWTIEAFKQAWRYAFLKSEIGDDLHFHDIRGTAVTMLAEAGCTVPEIATITGHSLASVNRILERYLNRTKALAESAIAKLELRMAG